MFAILQLNAKFMERQDCLKRLSANPKETGNNEQHLKATLPGKVGGDVVNVTAASDGQGTADPSVLGAPVSLGPGKWPDVGESCSQPPVSAKMETSRRFRPHCSRTAPQQ